jgi:hypothetical protein
MNFVHRLVLCNDCFFSSEITPISIVWWNGVAVSTQLRPTDRAILSNWKAVFSSQYYMMDTTQKPSIPKFKTLFESWNEILGEENTNDTAA